MGGIQGRALIRPHWEGGIWALSLKFNAFQAT